MCALGSVGKQRFVLDARPATAHFPGIGRYVRSLAAAMPSLLAEDEQLLLLVPPGGEALAPILPRVEVAASPFSARQQWQIPLLLRRRGASLYHSSYYLMPYLALPPTILTLYDLIPLRFPALSSARARLLFRLTTMLALRSATHALAISEATRQDFLRLFRLPPERISTVPLAAAPAFHPQPPRVTEALRQRLGLPPRFVLYLGSNKPHKNLVRLIEAWAGVEGEVRLVIAGAWDERFPEPRRRAAALGLEERILWLGRVAEAALPALYAAAESFVFPSLYEGFGLPVLEAMACGTPVACSATSSLPEVAGEAALLFDPEATEEIRAALRRLTTDVELRAALRQRGLERARRFSWTRTARLTLQHYRRVLLGSASA